MKNKENVKRTRIAGYIAMLFVFIMPNLLCGQNAKIEGVIQDCAYDTIYLADPYGDDFFSAGIDEMGGFSFEFQNSQKRVFHLGFHQGNYLEVFAAPNEELLLKLESDLADEPEIKGSAETAFLYGKIEELKDMYEVYHAYKAIADSIYEAFLLGEEAEFELSSETYEEYNLNPSLLFSDLSDTVDQRIVDLKDDIDLTLVEAIGSHMDYLASIYLIQILEFEDYSELYEQLDKEMMSQYPNNKLALNFHEDLLKKNAFAIGSEVPDIKQGGVDGQEIALSDYRGKIVLVDFWASWCGPCHGEIPTLKSAYEMYKDKGFEIFSVSLDDNKDKWVETIEQKGMPWVHVSDLKGWGNEAALTYNVEGIPFTLLIDERGKVIAKNLRGEALEDRLREMFSE